MKIIVCVDKNMGYMFFNKRVSQDGKLREYLISYVNDNRLFMSKYSSKQFKDECAYIIDDDYLNSALEKDYCFIEDKGFDMTNTSEVVICNFNRRYPADKFFNVDLKSLGFKRMQKTDIVGSSHDKITVEVYRRG